MVLLYSFRFLFQHTILKRQKEICYIFQISNQMLQRQLICISLFVLFIGNFAEKLRSNNRNWNGEKDDRLVYRKQRQVQSSQSGNNPSSSNQLLNPAEPAHTLLATSPECTADIQRYCVKGGTKLIINLKVLQCVDELDNVSFFQT